MCPRRPEDKLKVFFGNLLCWSRALSAAAWGASALDSSATAQVDVQELPEKASLPERKPFAAHNITRQGSCSLPHCTKLPPFCTLPAGSGPHDHEAAHVSSSLHVTSLFVCALGLHNSFRSPLPRSKWHLKIVCKVRSFFALQILRIGCMHDKLVPAAEVVQQGQAGQAC